MSRSITQTSSSSSAVAAGSSVIVPVNTTTGFNAGDYVYTLPSGGVGTRATGNVNIGADTPYVGTTFISTGLESVAFRSASYGPFVDKATFSGTTRTFGQVTIPANTVKSVYSYQTRSCTLANGNVVLMYNTGSSLFFKVIDSTGATIVAETTLTTTLQTSTVSGNFACCTLVSGNIQFAWTNNASTYQLYTAQYSPSGAVVIAAADQSSYTPNPGNFSMAALSGGGSVLCGSAGLTSVIYNPFFTILSSTGTLQGGGTATYGVGGGGQYYCPCVGLPSSYGTNIWAYCSQSTQSSAGYISVVGVYSGTTAVTSQNLTGIMGASGGETMSMTVATDGTIFCVAWAGSLYGQRLTYTKSTETSGSLSLGTYSYMASGASGILFSMANGMVGMLAHSGNNITLSTLSSTNVLTGPTVLSNAAQSSSTGNPGAFSGASFGSGYVSASYIQYTTAYVGQVGGASIAATNGSTVLQGSASYLPSSGYYLMGVAATTAAANSTGQVIVNGTAQLGSAYPTVTTPIYFSYQTTASQPTFGQRGVVNATTVTLKGLEA